jgi:hypothetical protein
VLATQEQAQAIELQWTALNQSQAAEYSVRHHRLSVDLFRDRRSARPDLSDRDIIRGMFNDDLQALMKRSDFDGLKNRYYEMAMFVAEEDKSPVELLAESRRMELRCYQRSGGIKRVEISAAGRGNACPACQRLDGKVLTLEDALRTMPLPCRDCTMVVVGNRPGFCRCLYLPVIR